MSEPEEEEREPLEDAPGDETPAEPTPESEPVVRLDGPRVDLSALPVFEPTLSEPLPPAEPWPIAGDPYAARAEVPRDPYAALEPAESAPEPAWGAPAEAAPETWSEPPTGAPEPTWSEPEAAPLPDPAQAAPEPAWTDEGEELSDDPFAPRSVAAPNAPWVEPQGTPEGVDPFAAAAQPDPRKDFLGPEPAIFTAVRWLLVLVTLAAVLPLWSAWRRGLLAGGSYESKVGLRDSEGFEALVNALHGTFGYSEWTGALLVLAVLLVVAGRVERAWGSGVLAAAFLLGSWGFNALRLGFEAGSLSLTAISGGWTGAAVVLGFGCALPGAGLGVGLISLGALVVVADAGGGAPGLIGVAAWWTGYLLGRRLEVRPSTTPTPRGCLLLLVTLGAVFAVELAVITVQVAKHSSDLGLFEGFDWSEPEGEREVGPLRAHPAAHLELELELPQGWRPYADAPDQDSPYVVFLGHGNERAVLWRFEPHPFNRDPDTFLLRNVIGEIGAAKNFYEAEQVLDEGPFPGALGRGYRVVTACSLRFTNGTATAGTRCSYCFNLDGDVVWLDCFWPTSGPEEVAYARKVCDSIARTVRPGADAPEGGPR